MNELAFTRCGSGAPLVLLHGLGSARDAWLPVTGSLARHFDVIALDLPGFGESAPLPAFEEPHPARLAQSVAATLRALDIEHPHIVGNSLGGWVALELAAIIAPASVTLLSPAGLWRQGTPGYCRVSLRASRFLARFLGGLLRAAVRTRLGRLTVFAQTSGRPVHLTPAQARRAITALGHCPGFRSTFRATRHRRYLATVPITAPVTVMFGARDRLLLRSQSRHLDELPSHTNAAELTRVGHVPMADDPAAIAALISQTARKARSQRDAATAL
jgi:pimeloyl-ACP methyl ester carboxylesterase